MIYFYNPANNETILKQMVPVNKQNISLKTRPEVRLQAILATKLTNLMNLPESEFNKLIKEVENDHLFKKLAYVGPEREKVISYKRFPKTDLAKNFYEINERFLKDNTSFDLESFLSGKERLIKTIKKIGIEKFKKYFLYNEAVSLKEISNKSGLEISEAKRVDELVTEISIYSQFYCSSDAPQVRYAKIASIKKDGKDFWIMWQSPNFARGRYSINYKKIEELKKKNFFTKTELKKLKKMLKKIETINWRKITSYQLLEKIIEKQKAYLESQEMKDIKPFTQLSLAREINLHPSLICRAIKLKSITMPWGEEKPLKDFFPTNKGVRKKIIEEIIENENYPHTDQEIKDILKKNGIYISRRSVTDCRKDLNILPAFRRAHK